MPEPTILTDISFAVDRAALFKATHVAAESDLAEELEQLVVRAEAIGRPKAMYRLAYVDWVGDDRVQIDGLDFTSRVLRVNLDAVHRVFAFVATCGMELENWGHSLDDLPDEPYPPEESRSVRVGNPLHQYWAEKIQEQALQQAHRAMQDHIMAHFVPGHLSTMNPGSLPDWPLREQRPLFALLDDPTAAIGVRLSDSLLMTPTKSVSGIKFPTETRFENCQLCPRPECPGRRASYDSDLYAARYTPARSGRQEE